MDSWDGFLRTPLSIDPAALVDPSTRERLDLLPSMLRIRGDAAPLDYEVLNGEGIARVRLREGQARRLRKDELPALDRPLHFAVQRGRHEPLLADSVPQLQAMLRRAPQPGRDDDGDRHRGGPRGRRRGGRGRRAARGAGAECSRTLHCAPRGPVGVLNTVDSHASTYLLGDKQG